MRLTILQHERLIVADNRLYSKLILDIFFS